MESLTLFVKNREHVDLLYQFLQHIDFVVLPTVKSKIKTVAKRKEHSIFNSAGMWADREISQEQLRAKAWKKAIR